MFVLHERSDEGSSGHGRVRMDMASQYLRSDWSTLNHNNQQELSMSKLNQYKDLIFLKLICGMSHPY